MQDTMQSAPAQDQGTLPHRLKAQGRNVVLSYPKSGKTWLGFLVTYYVLFDILGDVEARHLIEQSPFSFEPNGQKEFMRAIRASRDGDTFKRMVPAFAHLYGDRSVPYYKFRDYFQTKVLQTHLEEARFARTVLFVRDPRDVVISHYHHMSKLTLSTMPADMDLSEFLRTDLFGIRHVVAYLNAVLEGLPERSRAFRLMYFEDAVERPSVELAGLMEFLLESPSDARAVALSTGLATFDYLKTRERHNRQSAERDAPDPARFRVGKTRGYLDVLSADDLEFVNRVMRNQLVPELRARYLSV